MKIQSEPIQNDENTIRIHPESRTYHQNLSEIMKTPSESIQNHENTIEIYPES